MGLPKVAVRKSIEFLPSFPRSLSLALSSCPDNFWGGTLVAPSAEVRATRMSPQFCIRPIAVGSHQAGSLGARRTKAKQASRQVDMPRIQESWVTFGWWQWSLEKPGTCLPANLF
jgi:hypothetical protein